MMTPAEILAEAANVIERNGWTTDTFFQSEPNMDSRECSVCAIGAINVAADKLPAYGDMFEDGPEVEAVEYLAYRLDPFAMRTGGSFFDVVGNWNDSRLTSEEVTAELRAAAAELAAKEDAR